MSGATKCEECRAIFEELMAAGAELRPTKAGEELRVYGERLFNMMRGNAEAADELLAKFPLHPQIEPFQMSEKQRSWLSNPRIQAAVRKMIEHQSRTGHRMHDLFRSR